MTQQPYAAFGYVILENDIEEGSVINDELFKDNTYSVFANSPFNDGRFGDINSGYVWLYLSGKIKHTNLVTNEIKYRTAGYCNIETKEDFGFFKIEVLEKLKMFCLGPTVNSNRTPSVPNVSFFKLLSGNSQSLPAGTKLFLAGGDLNINGTALSGARQIKFGSSQRLVTATSDCYGLIFP